MSERLPSSVTLVVACFLPFHPDQMVLLVTPPPTPQSCSQHPGFLWKSVSHPKGFISLPGSVRQYQQLAWLRAGAGFSRAAHPAQLLPFSAPANCTETNPSHKPVCSLPQNPHQLCHCSQSRGGISYGGSWTQWVCKNKLHLYKVRPLCLSLLWSPRIQLKWWISSRESSNNWSMHNDSLWQHVSISWMYGTFCPTVSE